MVKLTVDGESVILATKNLAYPHSKFYAGELQIGSPFAALLRGESEIADIRIYSTMPERKSAALPERFPELIANIMKAPLIDGEISETEWGNVSRYTGFSKLPGGAVGHHQPVVRIGYDDQAVYIALKSPGHKRPPVAEKDRRDGNLWEDDGVEFYVSPGSAEERGVLSVHRELQGNRFRSTLPRRSVLRGMPVVEQLRNPCRIEDCRRYLEHGNCDPVCRFGKDNACRRGLLEFQFMRDFAGDRFLFHVAGGKQFCRAGKFGILRFAGKNAPVVDFSSLGGLSGGVAEFRCGIKGGSPAQLEVNAIYVYLLDRANGISAVRRNCRGICRTPHLFSRR